MSKSITETNIFGKAIDKVVGFLGKAIDKLKEFYSYIKGKFKAPGFETFSNILKTIWNSIKKVGAAVIKVASAIGKALGNAFRNGDMKSFLDLINGGIITSILLKLKNWISGFKDLAGEGKSFIDNIKEVLGTVGDSLTAWQQNIKAGTLQKIAISIGILAASLWVLSGIDPEKLGSALGAITILFFELIGAMKAFDKLGVASKGAGKSATLMIGMSFAVLILTSTLKKLADLDWEELSKGLIGVGALLAELVGAAKLMSMGGKNISKGAFQLVIMSVALKIMASVCEDLSELNWEELAKGISGIGGILAIFAGFTELIKLIKPKKMLSSALSLVIIGAAMEIFANVCSKFGKMEWSDLGKAGAAISGILLIAAGFGKLSGYSKKMLKSSIALVVIGAAMEIFADVCSKFGQMEWEELGKAGAAIAGILILAAGFALLSGLANKMFSSVVCLTIMAAAMEIFADVCNKFGQMEWEELGKAGVAIAGILILATGFALLSGLAPNILSSSAALLIMAVSLAIITPVLKAIGEMSWEEIAKGLITIAGAFAIIGVAGYLLAPIVPAILGLSGAIALLGLGCLAAGVGILAFSAGFLALTTVTASGAAAIVAALYIIVVGILEMIPAIVNALTDAIVALCQVFIQSVPAICEAIKVFIIELVGVLVECIPVLVDGLLQLIVSVLEALVEYTPQIVNGLVDLFIGILNATAERLPELVDSIMNFLIVLINSVASRITELIEPCVNLVGAIFQGIADAIGPIIQNVVGPILEILKSLIVDIVEAIAPYLPMLCDCFTTMTQIISDAIVKVVEAIAPYIPEITSMVETIANAFVSIVEQISPIIDSITGLIKQLGDTITEILGGIGDTVKDFGDAIKTSLDGVADVFDSAFGGVADVINSVGDTIKKFLDGIANVIDSVGEAALNAGTGFENLANGVKTITNLNLADMAASLTAVSIGVGKIASHSTKLAEAGTGMQQIANGTKLSAAAFNMMAIGITTVTLKLSSIGPIASASMATLVASVTGSASCFNILASVASSASSSVNASLASMGTTSAPFINAIKGLTAITSSAMSSIVNVINNARGQISASFSAIGMAMMTNMAVGIRSGGSRINSIFRSLMASILAYAKTSTMKFRAVGKLLITMFSNGIKSGSSVAKSSFSNLLTSALSTIKTYNNRFYNAGSSVAKGFADGIKDNAYKAEAQARIMAQNAATAAAKALKINSPSKVFRSIAYSIPEGFAQGIDRKAWMAEDSAVSMAETASNSISSAISKVYDLMNSDFDAQPTIRPVLDLSDINSGANYISSMFTGRRTISVSAAGVGEISTSMAKRQNGNYDLASAINKLAKSNSNKPSNTYNINGITYDDGSSVADAIGTLIRAAKIERRT